MSYIHKYTVNDKVLYLLSDKPSKPSGTITLKQGDWRGRALGRYNSVINQIEALSFTRKEEKTKEAMVQRILQAFKKVGINTTTPHMLLDKEQL